MSHRSSLIKLALAQGKIKTARDAYTSAGLAALSRLTGGKIDDAARSVFLSKVPAELAVGRNARTPTELAQWAINEHKNVPPFFTSLPTSGWRNGMNNFTMDRPLSARVTKFKDELRSGKNRENAFAVAGDPTLRSITPLRNPLPQTRPYPIYRGALAQS